VATDYSVTFVAPNMMQQSVHLKELIFAKKIQNEIAKLLY